MNNKNKKYTNTNFKYRESNRKLRKNKRVCKYPKCNFRFRSSNKQEYSKQNLKKKIISSQQGFKVKWLSSCHQSTIFKKMVKSNNPKLLNDYLGYSDSPKESFIYLKEFIFRFYEEMKIHKIEMIRVILCPFLEFKPYNGGFIVE